MSWQQQPLEHLNKFQDPTDNSDWQQRTEVVRKLLVAKHLRQQHGLQMTATDWSGWQSIRSAKECMQSRLHFQPILAAKALSCLAQDVWQLPKMLLYDPAGRNVVA